MKVTACSDFCRDLPDHTENKFAEKKKKMKNEKKYRKLELI